MKTFTTQGNASFFRKAAGKLLAAFFWLALWQIVCLAVRQEILIVPPLRVLERLASLSRTGLFWAAAFGSMARVLSGFLWGLLAGTVLAALTSRSRILSDLFHPALAVVRATPVASFIILALVWIRSARVPSFIAALVVLPVVWSNVENGIANTDPALLQMAKSFRFGAWKTVRKIMAPSVLPYFTAACTTGLGLAWKAGVAAEVLANTERSMGGQIYDSKIYLETADLFAWTAVVVLLSVVLEWLMVRLMRYAGRKYHAE